MKDRDTKENDMNDNDTNDNAMKEHDMLTFARATTARGTTPASENTDKSAVYDDAARSGSDADGTRIIEQTMVLFTSKSVIYYDDVIDDDFDDGLWPRPGEDDDQDGEPHCIYMDIGTDNEESGKGGERVCREKPEFYLEVVSSDPLDDKPQVNYYCPRHFALNLGYMCDRMARRTPEMEKYRFVDNGEVPDRYTILGWGRI